jgi:hypothetical protein
MYISKTKKDICILILPFECRYLDLYIFDCLYDGDSVPEQECKFIYIYIYVYVYRDREERDIKYLIFFDEFYLRDHLNRGYMLKNNVCTILFLICRGPTHRFKRH